MICFVFLLEGETTMSKTSALLQLIFFILLLIFGTYHLFKGQFEQSLLTVPIFAIYYVFVIARNKKNISDSKRDDQ
jgi:TRAP-type C4-dicarboxylate transport system permease small subunit